MVMTDGGGSNDLPPEELAGAQRDAICAYFVRCGVFEDAPTCKSLFFAGRPLYDLADEVRLGKVHYDPVKARACIDSIGQRSCERWKAISNRPLDPACYEAITGTVPAGGECQTNEMCISQFCNQPAACPMACCAGTCSSSPAPGPRQVTESCTSGYCVNSYCAAGVCVPYKQMGAMCQQDAECADGLSCRIGASGDPTMKTCEQMIPVNGPCGSTSDCAELSNVCHTGACQVGGLSTRPCADASECQLLHVCNATKCDLPPGPNESCGFVLYCQDSYCNTTTNVCTPRLADGGTCDPQMRGTECMSGVCDATTNMCVTPNCF
jgi:hypothetical protein